MGRSPVAQISIASPALVGREKEYVLRCLDSTRISSSGEFIDAFEKSFADFCGTQFALTCNNGTSALHLALAGLGIGPGDEVIVPALTYIATANAVVYCGAKPVLADVEPDTGNISAAELRRLITPRTKGVIAVHLYGHPADMDPIVEIAREHGLFVVEDAAEAHGALYKGRKIGSLGDAATFSFYGNKIITCGEGGAVTTNDGELFVRMQQLRGQGVDPQRRYWHTVVGYNYRMPNLLAAVALAQLEQIDWHLQRRREVAELYSRLLRGRNDVIVASERTDVRHAYWMYTVRLADHLAEHRDEIMAALAADGIETRPAFYVLHHLPPYEDKSIRLIESEKWARAGITLPTHAGLSEDDVAYVVGRLLERVRGYGSFEANRNLIAAGV